MTTAESNITNLQNTVNNISSGSAGLVQQSAAGANLTVGKGTDGAAVDFADKNGTARKLLKVAAGTVASGSTDAVNGGQLYTTNQAVAQNTAAISTLDGRVTTNEGDISTLKTDVTTGMDKLSNEMAKQDGRISSQGAMSMAEAQMASGAAAAAVGNPNGAWSVGLGSEQGHGAISAGYAKPVGRKSQISFGAAFGGDDHSIGVGFAHKL
ncbi:hypothetical protein [Lysobacter soli]|uniref:hypothetical protein n=1 Tax=Lysobacter soli TaxID=453783 RepID=UPI001C6EC98E|nr:hypothetical protein [Lysobacter soli]